jgi:ElaB/YqjD/DUF883 family membrane-anchored ribosome-binding protein
MDEGTRAERSSVNDTSGSQETRPPEEIREDIAATRDELGDTVEALAEKTDVKGQAKQRVEQAKETVRQKREELTGKAREATPEGARAGGEQVIAKVRENPAPAALGGAVLVGFLLGRLTRRR